MTTLAPGTHIVYQEPGQPRQEHGKLLRLLGTMSCEIEVRRGRLLKHTVLNVNRDHVRPE